ncbi:MAG TPA: M15 family metallopeptidase [Acidimicrobiales bacterium]|nr:M15 family metallopeptidase [Acidimicrobiales bacterium]
MTLVRHRSLIAASVVAVLATAATTLVGGAPSGAQQSPAAESGQVADTSSLVSIDVDVLKAEDRAVDSALSDVRENVEAQKNALQAAQDRSQAAKDKLTMAKLALADTQKRLDDLTSKADAVVIDAFVNPPAASALDVLAAGSTADATVKKAILDRQSDADAAVLTKYQAIQARLDKERDARRKAEAAARAAQEEADAAQADVAAAVGQQATFVAQVEARLDQRLAEADNLAKTDPALAAQIRDRANQLAMQLHALDVATQNDRAKAKAAELAAQAASVRSVSSSIKPVPGGVATAVCPSGGSIQIAGDIQRQIERLLTDATNAGINLCGNGYRDPAEQIAVRRANCGTSPYAIYEAPSSYCSPPTARPGTSMHEQGLAIDFTIGGSTIGRGSAAFNWLQANAANYGMYNLPSEPWHWSVSGE